MNKYAYKGPVTEFGSVIAYCWEGSTCAVSEKKARSNLAYQFKKEYGKCPDANVNLPGKITMIKEGREPA